MPEPIIRVRGLTRRFGAVTAVDGLSFDVGRGELFGIVGPDGAGKTTLLHMLAGVLRPTSGDAEIVGVSVAARPERVKHTLAYMSQRFGLYADLTVAENLDFYADLYRVPRSERPQRRERLYQFSGLEPFHDRLAGKLSGGMKQKLGLSCALIHQPEALLLDEPTFGVDPISRRDLWIIIHERVAEGVTVVVSTSYMDEAERFDRVGFLHEGHFIAVDTPAGLLRIFDGQIVAVTARPLEKAREICERLPDARRSMIFGDKLHVSVASAETAAPMIEAALAGAGVEVVAMTRVPASLEDVFIQESEPQREHDA
ncbi:MAG TPA: ABC transporter ATP-binding protein [Thermoanaerobaculia bacterium]|nr:ABC transporter ATP-binding protein [Thermoanaerobaculia bacterium]